MSKCVLMERPTIESVKRRLFDDGDDDDTLWERPSKRVCCDDTQA